MTSEPKAPSDRIESPGVRALLGAFASAALCTTLTYLTPALADYRPWVPGDPLPIVSALLPSEHPRVVEDITGELVTAEAHPAPAALVAPVAPVADPISPVIAALPQRPPGVATPIVDAEYRGMDPWYRALHATQASGVARAAHYGDSTIAADGITRTVRDRLQARFGDGGPGYLSAGMDPRWSVRKDVKTTRAGSWNTVSLLLGGGGGRYSYGGIVATADPDASVSMSAPPGTRMTHLELWYQAGPAGGDWFLNAEGTRRTGSANSAATEDRRHVVEVPDGYARVSLGASGGPVPFYGIVMETGRPGVVWDALGVVGVGARSFTQHSRKHLAAQVSQRNPDLIVVMLGGNELGLPVLGTKGGAGYVPYFRDTLRRIRQGAPESGCLIITPVDQGTREGGQAKTKPNLARLVEAERLTAEQEGCAFWNAWQAMGGTDSILRWSKMRPPLAWTDLNHLSAAGQEIVGNLLADAIEHGYDGWVAADGPTQLPPPAPGVEIVSPAVATLPDAPSTPEPQGDPR